MQDVGATLSLSHIQHINKKEMAIWLWHFIDSQLIVGRVSTDSCIEWKLMDFWLTVNQDVDLVSTKKQMECRLSIDQVLIESIDQMSIKWSCVDREYWSRACINTQPWMP